MTGSSRRYDLAAQAWRLLFGFLISTRHQRDAALQSLQLTPNDARAFTSLNESEGRTMRSLAEEWGCDASNATWIIDRLEKRGFAERRTALDRRVKLVVLTPLGAETKWKLLQTLDQPPPEVLALDEDDLSRLVEALRPLSPDEAVSYHST